MLPTGKAFTLIDTAGNRCHIALNTYKEKPTVGILIWDGLSNDVFRTNACHMKIPIGLEADKNCLVKYMIDKFNLSIRQYTLTGAAHRVYSHFHEYYQWVDAMRSFEVVGCKDFPLIGIFRLNSSVQEVELR